MRKEFASGNLLLSLLLLLLLLVAHGNGAREMYEKQSLQVDLMATGNGDHIDNVLRLPSVDADDDKNMDDAKQENDDSPRHVHDPNPSSIHAHHFDPSSFIYFTTKDLSVGKTMPLNLPKMDLAYPHFLPREIAESIPFSSKQLPRLLQFYSSPEGSPRAKRIEETLMVCEAKPSVNGETKFCATSLESLLDSVGAMLGVSRFHILTTNHLTESKNIFQNYTIREMPQEVKVPRVLPCHPIPYPYAVFFCHRIPESRVFKISLEGENGDRIEAVGICHMNTTGWDANHEAFRVLGVKPGFSEICHFFPANNLVWVPHVHV